MANISTKVVAELDLTKGPAQEIADVIGYVVKAFPDKQSKIQILTSLQKGIMESLNIITKGEGDMGLNSEQKG